MRPGKRSSAATGCAEDPGIGGAVATSLQTAEARSKPWRFGLCQTHLWEISGLIYPWMMVNLSMNFMMDTRRFCPSFPKLDFEFVMAPMVS